MAGTAANLITGFEGFAPSAKWDANAFRNGIGSDTMTAIDGTVSSVRKGDSTTLDAATRDLKRRVSSEFMPKAEKASGSSWDNYSPEQKAALTSIVYNYGSVTPRKGLAKAVRGGDAGAIVRSMMNLGKSDNGGVLLARRKAEATAFTPEQVTKAIQGGLAPRTSMFPKHRPGNEGYMWQGKNDQPQNIQQAALGGMNFGNNPRGGVFTGGDTMVAASGKLKAPSGYMVDPQNNDRLRAIPGGPKDVNAPTNQTLNKTFAINSATKSLNEALDNYGNLVDKYGIEIAPGVGKDSLETTRRIIQMQMKELFNLGVLNGPDLDLMNQMLTDVTSLSGAASGLMGNLFGDSVQKRAHSNINLLKQNFEMLRRNQTPKGYGSQEQQSDADFLKSLGLN